ncbi:hypothetical protein [Nocardia gipuzkoensis]
MTASRLTEKMISRLCVKILRATAMLDGAHAHHDFGHMAPHLAEQMRTELRWRADPTPPPMDPGRFWTYLHHAFTRFDTEFGQPRPEAVNYTRYAVTSSGRIVARHYQTVHALARAMTDASHATPDPIALTTVKQRVWERITGWTGGARRNVACRGHDPTDNQTRIAEPPLWPMTSSFWGVAGWRRVDTT